MSAPPTRGDEPSADRIEARIRAQFVIPVLRCSTPDGAIATALALAEGGLKIVELTISTPDVFVAVERLRSEGLCAGVGTVTRPAEVHTAADAGANFVVSFTRPAGFMEAAASRTVLAVPGAMTPTEVHAAVLEGAGVVKLFPARVLGREIIADLRPLMPGVRFIATGGIPLAPASISAWLRSGATAVGIGRALGEVDEVGTTEVTRRARRTVEHIAEARNGAPEPT